MHAYFRVLSCELRKLSSFILHSSLLNPSSLAQSQWGSSSSPLQQCRWRLGSCLSCRAQRPSWSLSASWTFTCTKHLYSLSIGRTQIHLCWSTRPNDSLIKNTIMTFVCICWNTSLYLSYTCQFKNLEHTSPVYHMTVFQELWTIFESDWWFFFFFFKRIMPLFLASQAGLTVCCLVISQRPNPTSSSDSSASSLISILAGVAATPVTRAAATNADGSAKKALTISASGKEESDKAGTCLYLLMVEWGTAGNGSVDIHR